MEAAQVTVASMASMASFDPDAAAAADSGIFGLRHGRSAAAVILVPAPFDATASGHHGAAAGPAAILEASHQVDLFDLQTGRPYEAGIHMLDADGGLLELSARTRALAEPVIERGEAGVEDAATVSAVDAAGARVNQWVHGAVAAAHAEGKIAGVVGGDHSVAFGGIAAAAERWPGLGVLHIDAHADLRPAYQGFRWSHASVMHNVLAELPGVARVVQVGVRDLCSAEMAAIAGSGGRVVTHFDLDWARRMARGEVFDALCDEAVGALPECVHVSFDIDGLDPALCSHTGTPVPGGLSFNQACLLLEAVHRAGRRIVGFDLTEVAPGTGARQGDAAVGARILYKLCGFALMRRAL